MAGLAPRSSLAQSGFTSSCSAERLSCEAPAVHGRGFTGQLAKGGGKRACLAKSDIEPNFRHRQLAITQQGLGSLNALPGQVSVRRHAKRLFERSGKMKQAELYQLSQR